jgi:uncharacterized protein YegL
MLKLPNKTSTKTLSIASTGLQKLDIGLQKIYETLSKNAHERNPEELAELAGHIKEI